MNNFIKNYPKYISWPIITFIVIPTLGYFFQTYITDGVFNLNFIKISYFIIPSIILLLIIGSFISMFRCIESTRGQTSQQIKIISNKKLLPYRDVSIGKYVTSNINVDILAEIILGETITPDIEIFLKRLKLGNPYCPSCQNTYVRSFNDFQIHRLWRWLYKWALPS